MKAISSSKWGASLLILRTFYITYIRSKLDYGAVVYDSATEAIKQKLEIIQNNAMRLMIGARNTTPILSLQVESHLPPLKLHRAFNTLKKSINLRFVPPL